MSRKSKTLEILTMYFLEKGKILTRAEYRAATDTPVRYKTVKTVFGNWSRIPKMIEINYPEEYAEINAEEVIKPKKIEIPKIKIPRIEIPKIEIKKATPVPLKKEDDNGE